MFTFHIKSVTVFFLNDIITNKLQESEQLDKFYRQIFGQFS